MKSFLLSKEKQGSICAFFAMLLAMGIVGSYYLQYNQDLYWVKLFTYAMLILCSGYVFISSLLRKESSEASAALILLIILFACELESLFHIIGRADWRQPSEAITMAFKAFGTFTLIDILAYNCTLAKKLWYILTSLILLMVPAIMKSLPILFTSLTTGFLADNISLFNIIFSAILTLYGVAGLITALLQFKRNKNSFIIWSSIIYSASIFLYGVFGLLRQFGYNAVQWSKNTAILFEIGTMMLLISIINLNKPNPVKSNKRK